VRRLWVYLLSVPLFAGIVPNRYIVELTGESAAHYIARTFPPNQRRAALAGGAGMQARARVRFEQAAVRIPLERRGARVVGSLDTLANVLFVEMPTAQVARLRSVRGVRRVLPERTYRLTLDHALPLHKVPQAWSMGGAYPLPGAAGISARQRCQRYGIHQSESDRGPQLCRSVRRNRSGHFSRG
jgi:hypothetical protein